MSNSISLEKKDYIKKCLAAGQKSPKIARDLTISVWTVRKYAALIKKRVLYQSLRDVRSAEL